MGSRAAALAWSLGGLAPVLYIAGVVLGRAGSSSAGPQVGVTGQLIFAALLTYAAVGALVAARRPANPIGWLLVSEGLLFQLAGFSLGYASYGIFAHPGSLPAPSLVAWAGDSVWIPAVVVAALVFLLFPTGHLLSPRWQPVVWIGLTVAAVAFAGETLRPGPLDGSLSSVDNPVGIPGTSDVLPTLGDVASTVVGPLLVGAALLSCILRFRASAGTLRRQMRWLAWAASVLAGGFLVGDVLEALGAPSSVYPLFYLLPLVLLPITVGVAVLRYRLYEIEIVIDRTLVFAGVVGFAAAVYLAVLVGVGAAVGSGTGSNVVLAVVATAVVALSLQPVLTQVQRLARNVAYGSSSEQEIELGVAIRSLGAFRVFRNGVPVPANAWQSKKARTLLKILVSRRGRATPRAVVMETLWPDDDPAKLGNRLSVALATVRAVLDPDKEHGTDHFVVADNDAARLDLRHVAVDIEAFFAWASSQLTLLREGNTGDAASALGAADSSYPGDFLEEDLYEPWASPLREEASATYIAVVRALAERASAVGDDDTAARAYLRLLDKDPWDEPAHLSLVRVLERAGRHGEARRRYRAYASSMADLDLPVAPFPA